MTSAYQPIDTAFGTKQKVGTKIAANNLTRVKANLVVEFSGEEGIDAGAVRNEFFTQLMQGINYNMFEGPANRRTPKHQWGLENEFELCGMKSTKVQTLPIIISKPRPQAPPTTEHVPYWGQST